MRMNACLSLKDYSNILFISNSNDFNIFTNESILIDFPFSTALTSKAFTSALLANSLSVALISFLFLYILSYEMKVSKFDSDRIEFSYYIYTG